MDFGTRKSLMQRDGVSLGRTVVDKGGQRVKATVFDFDLGSLRSLETSRDMLYIVPHDLRTRHRGDTGDVPRPVKDQVSFCRESTGFHFHCCIHRSMSEVQPSALSENVGKSDVNLER